MPKPVYKKAVAKKASVKHPLKASSKHSKKVAAKKLPSTCVACGGSGKSSKGGVCYPCGGHGKKRKPHNAP